jgi:hypothetical protein
LSHEEYSDHSLQNENLLLDAQLFISQTAQYPVGFSLLQPKHCSVPVPAFVLTMIGQAPQ